MKKKINLLTRLNRRGAVSLGVIISTVLCGIIAFHVGAQSSDSYVGSNAPDGWMPASRISTPAVACIGPGPSAGVAAPSNVNFTKAFIYDDAFGGPTGPYQSALTLLGIPTTDFGGNFNAFNIAVAGADPRNTLVIVDDFNNFQNWDASSLSNFVNAGGRVIYFYFDLDGTTPAPFGSGGGPTTATRALFQTSVANTFGEPAPFGGGVPLPVYFWPGSAALSANLTNPMPAVDSFFIDNGDMLQPSGGAMALGGFTPAPQTNQAALVSGNQGRTLLQGFSIDEVPGTACDRLNLALNEIGLVSNGQDFVPPKSTIVIDDVAKNEGNTGTTPFTFTVSRLGPIGFTVVVNWETRDGSATVAGGDYVGASGVLTFGPADTSKTITINVNGDTTPEPFERFTVHLLNDPVNAIIGDADGIGLIINDDFASSAPDRFEGDINRPGYGNPGTGDGDVTVGDQIQYQRFLSGVDCPSANEASRLDAGPISSHGDGVLGASDGAAIAAYARHDASTDYDPNTPGWQATPMSGPASMANLSCTASPALDAPAKTESPESAAARIFNVTPTSGHHGSDVIVYVGMAAQGDEAGTQYSLRFDPGVMSVSSVSGVGSNPDITAGNDAPTGTTLNVNASNAANGSIAIIETFNSDAAASLKALPVGPIRIAKVTFHILNGAPLGASRVTFDDTVVSRITSDVTGITLGGDYDQSGTVTVMANGVSVSGRVTTSDGRGLRNAKVSLIDSQGMVKTATTSSFGLYTFDNLELGSTYTISVTSRQYRFAPRTLAITDTLSSVDFTGLE